MRGDGRVYLKQGSRNFHGEFWLDGRPVRFSTGKVAREDAEKVLRRKIEEAKRGDAIPHEERVTLADLFKLLEENYRLRRNRSINTMPYSFKHLLTYFGEKAKAVKLPARTDDYVAQRREEGAAESSIRYELALLDRAGRLAVKKRLLSHRNWPDIEKPAEDPSRVRKGFFRRDAIERLCAPCDCSPLAVHARSWTLAKRATRPDVQPCWHLPRRIADVVEFLFFCPWRVGAARRLEWRDYSEADRALTLRPELNKTGHELQIPVDAENTPELMAVIERQKVRRRPDCPFIFHGSNCGTVPRYDKKGNRRPCLGDFQKVWAVACAAIGMAGRIPHDLRRSGVKHYIDAGVDPHTVMAWSGHRTTCMLRRYHIIDLDDLRRAGKKASDYRGPKDNVVRGDFGRERTRTEPAQDDVFSRPASEAGSVRG